MYGLPDAIWATPDYVRAAITRRLPRLAWIPGEADLRLPHQNRLLRDGHAFVRRAMGWTNRHVVAVFPDRSRLYADYENSLRRELRPWVEQLLFDERTLSRGLYDADALRALWARHVSGHELHTMGKVVQVMAIEMALRYVVEGETAEAACGVSG